jgi:hypothetical protein
MEPRPGDCDVWRNGVLIDEIRDANFYEILSRRYPYIEDFCLRFAKALYLTGDMRPDLIDENWWDIWDYYGGGWDSEKFFQIAALETWLDDLKSFEEKTFEITMLEDRLYELSRVFGAIFELDHEIVRALDLNGKHWMLPFDYLDQLPETIPTKEGDVLTFYLLSGVARYEVRRHLLSPLSYVTRLASPVSFKKAIRISPASQCLVCDGECQWERKTVTSVRRMKKPKKPKETETSGGGWSWGPLPDED